MISPVRILFAFLLCLPSASIAQTPDRFPDLRQTGSGFVVARVIDPLRIQLKEDGRIIQLSGIDMPDLTPQDAGEQAVAAQEKLAELLAEKRVRLYQTPKKDKGRMNRMGHHLAHVETQDDNIWVQGMLLEEGLARVLPSMRNPEMATAMMAAEEGARQEQKGLWADEKYSVLTPDTAIEGLDGWAIVEGKVHAAALVKNKLYLNFGENWKTDFTIVVTSAVRKQMVKEGIDPLSLGGQTIRVRGWVEEYNGPYIELAHAVWLELPDGVPSASKEEIENP